MQRKNTKTIAVTMCLITTTDSMLDVIILCILFVYSWATVSLMCVHHNNYINTPTIIILLSNQCMDP